MKKTILVSLCMLFCIFVSTTFATEVTLLGPNQYLRTSGAPNVYTDTFSAIAGEGKLIVKNGSWDGESRIVDAISSASVFLNGRQIFGPSDFNQQVHLLEKPVNLSENNTISIELASSPGSYLIIEVREEVDPPTVTFSADPLTIHIGDSSILTWSSINADSCVIEPDIGSVDINGSTTVTPAETTPYTITATGTGGSSATDSTTITVTPLITLTITSPNNGSTISRPYVMVQGKITNAGGSETGVVVNGILAMVHGDQFVANHVPLQEGENTITATTTDTAGYSESDSITVNVENIGDYIKITAMPESGISPLETRLSIDGPFSFTASFLTYTAPGAIELLESSPDEYLASITGEGIYYVTAEVTDAENNVHLDTVAVLVLDQAQLDALLRTKWDEMKSALGNQDVEEALVYFLDHSKEKYRGAFNAISDTLSQLVSDMQDIEMIYAKDRIAKYRINRLHIIDGDTVTITYYIYFAVDWDGIWKIDKF